MRVLAIAALSFRRALRYRTSLFFMFALPVVLILVVGLVFGSGFASKVAIIVPPGDDAASQLARSIEDAAAFDVVIASDVDDARARIRRNDIDAAVVIPDGYGADLAAGTDVEIGYYASPTSRDDFEIRSVVEAAAAGQSAVFGAARFAAGVTDADLDEALASARTLRERIPPVDVVVEGGTGDGGGGAFGAGAAQELVLFMFMTALASSTALIEARRLGVSRRMLSTPTSAGSIVGGETLGRFVVVLFQGVFIVLAARVLFGVDWGDPVAASLVVVTFALAGTGYGMLLGSMFSNEQQAGGIAVFGALVFAALGGSMVPLEIFPSAMVTVAHVTPHAWANDAFSTLIRHGGGVRDIAKELAVLTGYGVALIALSSVLLRRHLIR